MNEQQTEAIRKWYEQTHVTQEAKRLFDKKAYEDIEELLQKDCLMPLGRHDELPEFMLDDEGKTLFPTNLDPRADLELWRDAVEVAWQVMEQKLGIIQEDFHKAIAQTQKDDWEEFLKRAEARKKREGLK